LNPEHLEIVNEGISAISQWHINNPTKKLNLSDANLYMANLFKADLSNANLSKANLMRSDLSGADLSGANLLRADLSDADLSGADLSGANLSGANLLRANLFRVNLLGADLTSANLSEANLSKANLSGADLSDADLSSSVLHATYFSEIKAINTNLSNSSMSGVDLVSCDISQIKGLVTIEHDFPSSVGIDTLEKTFKSKMFQTKSGKDIKMFFIKAGVPRELLNIFPKILAEVRYRTAFIAYGEPDVNFAERIHSDLLKNGVTCWLYKTDKTIGEKTWREIGYRRRKAEKFIVLCSSKSLIRDGLLKELEEQIDEDVDKLIPISLDDLWKHDGFLVMRAGYNLKPYILERNYADFGHSFNYKENLGKLLKALETKINF